MQTLEQQFAQKIYGQVCKIEPKSQQAKEYGSMAHKLPVLIRQAGLVQALAYVAARGKPGARQLLDDLAVTLGIEGDDRREQLLARSREAPLIEYMRLSREAIIALTWCKRFAQSVLGVEPTEEGG